MEKDFISGGISGAITDPYSDKALLHAEMYYEEIRKMSTDVEKIAQNTGFTKEQILTVKNYLFNDAHYLQGEIKRFSPCFEIAESWQRLAFDPDNIKPHDITLINHELTENQLVSSGISQDQAHRTATREYNYTLESKEYYKQLGIDATKLHEKDQNSGAVNENDYDISDDWGLSY